MFRLRFHEVNSVINVCHFAYKQLHLQMGDSHKVKKTHTRCFLKGIFNHCSDSFFLNIPPDALKYREDLSCQVSALLPQGSLPPASTREQAGLCQYLAHKPQCLHWSAIFRIHLLERGRERGRKREKEIERELTNLLLNVLFYYTAAQLVLMHYFVCLTVIQPSCEERKAYPLGSSRLPSSFYEQWSATTVL